MNDKVMIFASKKGYKVDDKGNVTYNKRVRALVKDTKGYYSFTIRIYDKTKKKDVFRRVWVHKLQAYQKFGKAMLKDGIQVRHFDGNEINNSNENILIGTQSDNMMDRPEHLRKSLAINASKKNRVFTDQEIKLINQDRKEGLTYKKLVEKYNTSKSTLSYIFNNAQYNTDI